MSYFQRGERGLYSPTLIGEEAPISDVQTVVSLGEDAPGEQEPDLGALSSRVAGHPGREKSKKLSEQQQRKGSIIIMEGFRGSKKRKERKGKENSWKERGLLQK